MGDSIGARISQELDSYQPIIKGVCAYVGPLSQVERNKIDEIDSSIEAYQPKAGKDAADYLLLDKGQELIDQHNPETLVIVSGDHIFTSLLEFQENNEIKVVLFHIGNISKKWLSAGIDIRGINVLKPSLNHPNPKVSDYFDFIIKEAKSSGSTTTSKLPNLCNAKFGIGYHKKLGFKNFKSVLLKMEAQNLIKLTSVPGHSYLEIEPV